MQNLCPLNRGRKKSFAVTGKSALGWYAYISAFPFFDGIKAILLKNRSIVLNIF